LAVDQASDRKFNMMIVPGDQRSYPGPSWEHLACTIQVVSVSTGARRFECLTVNGRIQILGRATGATNGRQRKGRPPKNRDTIRERFEEEEFKFDFLTLIAHWRRNSSSETVTSRSDQAHNLQVGFTPSVISSVTAENA
jgi:hypothetical protein